METAASHEVAAELWNRLAGYARRQLGDAHAAEDVLQEVKLALHKARQNGETIKNLPAWLFSVAFKKVGDVGRRRARDREVQQKFREDGARFEESVLSVVERTDLLRRLDDAINNLPEDLQQIVRSKLNDESFVEIAAELGRTERTVRFKYGKAVKQIGSYLRPLSDGNPSA